MKKGKIIIIVIIVLLIAGIVGYVVIDHNRNKNTGGTNVKTTTKKVTESEQKLLDVLKTDNEIKNLVFGDVKLLDASTTIDDKTYYMYDGNIKSIQSLMDSLDIYTYSAKNEILDGMKKYNELVEVDGKLYVKKNKKCVIDDYVSDIKILEQTEKNFIYNYNGKGYSGFIEEGKFTIMFTPFNCD